MSQSKIINSLSKQELEDILCDLSNSNWKVKMFLYKINKSYTEVYFAKNFNSNIKRLLDDMIEKKSVPILRDRKINRILNI